MPLFSARYDGYCRGCREDIFEGDLIGYDLLDEIVCEDCYVEAKGEEPEEPEPVKADWRKRL